MDADDPKALPIPPYALTILRLLRENLRLKLRAAALEHELEQAKVKADMADELEVRCAALSAKLANARKQKAAATRKWQSEVKAQRKQEAA